VFVADDPSARAAAAAAARRRAREARRDDGASTRCCSRSRCSPPTSPRASRPASTPGSTGTSSTSSSTAAASSASGPRSRTRSRRRRLVGDAALALFRSGAFDAAETGGTAEVKAATVELEDFSSRRRWSSRRTRSQQGPSIEDADVIVAGGRGLGEPEKLRAREELAQALGGAVAATRAVVDAGWYPYAAQVGQTGKTVSPKLYVALGISGAIQHKVGMQSSENVIVAINKDPNAPIFEFSDLGVVGDLHKIVPKLTELVKARARKS
jgi:hypothetical protein